MADTVEAQGHTVDEAIQLALNQLGASRDKVEIEIVHHPRGGFLGIGARRAKVRATLRPGVMMDGDEFDMAPDSSSDSRRRGRGGRRRRGGRRSGGGEATSNNESGNSQSTGGGEGSRSGGEASRGRDDGGDGGGDGGGNQRRGGRGRGGGGDRGRGRGRDQGQGQGQGQGGSRDSGRGRDAGQGEGSGRDQRVERAATPPAATEQGAAADKAPSDSAGSGERNGERREGGSSRRRGRGRGRRGRGENREARSAPADAQKDAAATQSEPGTAVTTDAVAAPQQPATGNASAESPRGERGEGRRRRRPAGLPENPESLRLRAVELATELFQRMDFGVEVEATINEAEQEIVVDVRSDKEGLLIGRRGQTLDAIEHIVTRMVMLGEGGGEGCVLVDVGGYRKRRRVSLVDIAGRMKDRALSEQRGMQVAAMSPRDRKYFVTALDGDNSIDVRSLGSGFYRRVLVAPPDWNQNREQRQTPSAVDLEEAVAESRQWAVTGEADSAEVSASSPGPQADSPASAEPLQETQHEGEQAAQPGAPAEEHRGGGGPAESTPQAQADSDQPAAAAETTAADPPEAEPADSQGDSGAADADKRP